MDINWGGKNRIPSLGKGGGWGGGVAEPVPTPSLPGEIGQRNTKRIEGNVRALPELLNPTTTIVAV